MVKEGWKNLTNLEKNLNDFSQIKTIELMDKVIAATDYLSKYKRESEENLARLENIKELRSVATEFPNLEKLLENVALVEAEQNEKGGFKTSKKQRRKSNPNDPPRC